MQEAETSNEVRRLLSTQQRIPLKYSTNHQCSPTSAEESAVFHSAVFIMEESPSTQCSTPGSNVSDGGNMRR